MYGSVTTHLKHNQQDGATHEADEEQFHIWNENCDIRIVHNNLICQRNCVSAVRVATASMKQVLTQEGRQAPSSCVNDRCAGRIPAPFVVGSMWTRMVRWRHRKSIQIAPSVAEKGSVIHKGVAWSLSFQVGHDSSDGFVSRVDVANTKKAPRVPPATSSSGL